MRKGSSFISRALACILSFATMLIMTQVTAFAEDNTESVTFLNSGYPYGKDMTSSEITLVIEIDGTSASYQWQEADSKDGTFKDIIGATESTYRFEPVTGKWYRCMVNGTASKAVMAVKPGEDGRTWTKPYNSWYLSNGTMAYMANSSKFDAVGLYTTKNNTNYMLCTSYGCYWQMFSSSFSTPSSGDITSPALDALRVSFSESDDYALIFEADLTEGQQAFSFGCDTQLGDRNTSGSYYDRAALMATVKNGALQQVAMIGAGTVAGAADTDPAFVIAPVDPASRFWIGNFNSRETYAYNTSAGNAYETIDGQNVVTLLEGDDSGMTMSWMNIPSGGSVRFQFSVGDVKHTGAVGGKVDYEKDVLTGLETGTTYIIKAGESTYTITANASGEIPLSGTDDAGNAYDFAGKSLNIAKQGSEDTPAEVEVVGRPDTPENPSDLEEEESGTSTPTVDESIEIVELTPNSATISPKKGQQYAYSTDGTNWTILTNTESNGTYAINGLTEGATIYIRTRIPATSSTPASQWSGSTQIKLKKTVAASANSWSGSYDGNVHQITVNVTSPLENASIEYSSTADGNYNVENPSFKDAGEHKVYYRVMAEGYYPTYGSATVTISQREVGIDWNNITFTYDRASHKPTATLTGVLVNDACNVTVTGEQTNAGTNYIATASIDNDNYKLKSSDVTTTFVINPKEMNAEMISLDDADRIYDFTNSAITPAVTVKDGTAELTVGETGDYVLSGDLTGTAYGSYEIAVTGRGNYTGTSKVVWSITDRTLTIEDHTLVTDAAVAATCTKSGISEGSHCSVCNEVIVAQKEVPALGHDWSGEWTIVKEATATTDGKRETICTRDGCGQKKYETIHATGTPEEPEDPNAGKLDKDAEVEPDAQIDETTIDNKKSELLDAPAIFTEAEKQQIQSGTDARVWLEVKRTDESSIPTEDKKEVTEKAEKIMGENPMITFFDADLFKQVEGGDKAQIHEPGIDIKVTILIPDELINYDRTMVREYKIIRLHYDPVTGESKIDVLSGDFDRGTGEFSFKTDKFSTFAIAYTDIQLVTGITMTTDNATLTSSGETVQLMATVAPDNAANKNVIWTSSDQNVATVDANGKVTAVGNGTCIITATTEDGNFTDICTIKVEKTNVEAPKTGYANNATHWLLLLTLSALALAGIRVERKKEKRFY